MQFQLLSDTVFFLASLHGWVLQPLFVCSVIIAPWMFCNSQLTVCMKWSQITDEPLSRLLGAFWKKTNMFSFFFGSYDYSGYGQSSGKVHISVFPSLLFSSICIILIIHFLSNTAAQWAKHICWYRGCLQMSHRNLCSRWGKYHSLWPVSGQWSYFGFGLTFASFESSCCT
jgi:hypothetical protein